MKRVITLSCCLCEKSTRKEVSCQMTVDIMLFKMSIRQRRAVNRWLVQIYFVCIRQYFQTKTAIVVPDPIHRIL